MEKETFRTFLTFFRTEKTICNTVKNFFRTILIVFRTENQISRTEKSCFRMEKILFRTERSNSRSEKAKIPSENFCGQPCSMTDHVVKNNLSTLPWQKVS
jgi:hypothetical protein